MYVPDRIGVGSIRRNGEEDGVPAVLQPLGTYFLPDGLPFLGKCREVAADSRAVVDAPADALTRAYALEVIDQPCAHIWRDFLAVISKMLSSGLSETRPSGCPMMPEAWSAV